MNGFMSALSRILCDFGNVMSSYIMEVIHMVLMLLFGKKWHGFG